MKWWWKKRPPRSPASHGALPPKGAAFCLGTARRQKKDPAPAPETAIAALAFEELTALSLSWDGHQREAAVNELARRADPRAIGPLARNTPDRFAFEQLWAEVDFHLHALDNA
jgi:hypothetical protein